MEAQDDKGEAGHGEREDGVGEMEKWRLRMEKKSLGMPAGSPFPLSCWLHLPNPPPKPTTPIPGSIFTSRHPKPPSSPCHPPPPSLPTPRGPPLGSLTPCQRAGCGQRGAHHGPTVGAAPRGDAERRKGEPWRGAALSPRGTVKCLSTSASSLLGEGIGHKQTGPEAGEAARRASLPPPPPKSRPFPASEGKGMERGGEGKILVAKIKPGG